MYRLEYKQHIPVTLDKAWEFFSSPKNLNKITPPDLSFKILSPESDIEKMYEGQIIMYKVKPFPFFEFNWVTEITQVRDNKFFIDEQRFGPYKFWHHQHHFREVMGGVEMVDLLHYDLPFGIVGKLVHPILIEKKVNSIFEYRKKIVDEIFGII